MSKKSRNPERLMQYQLLKLALLEEDVTSEDIIVDHKKGLNYVNGKELELKYPNSFVHKIASLSTEKKYQYCFKGGLTCSSATFNRTALLEKFQGPNSVITDTQYGIKRKDKTVFDEPYYQLLSNSLYSLCPNWAGKHWDHDFAWTYRFIESALCKTLPVVFRETPLGTNNTKDLFFLWSDELHTLSKEDYSNAVNDNYIKAVSYWTLQPDEVLKITKR